MSKLRTETEPRVVFMGMRGSFSRPPLLRLLQHEFTVPAVIVPAHPAEEPATAPLKHLTPAPTSSDIPLLRRSVEPNIVELAWKHGVPVLEVSRLADPATLEALAAHRPDVIAVACFNQRFPPALLKLPEHGCLNLHPSLLPAYRGPAPLFWAFRNGERETGVTVHLMDEGMDTGDILRQQPIAIPDGVRGDTLEVRCAEVGGELMVEAIRSLVAGTAKPVPQPEDDASSYPWPSVEDFVVPATWPARRAFNFIRGVAHWDGPLAIQVAGQRLPVRDAVSFAPDETLDSPFIQEGRDLWVQCTPGVLHARRRD